MTFNTDLQTGLDDLLDFGGTAITFRGTPVTALSVIPGRDVTDDGLAVETVEVKFKNADCAGYAYRDAAIIDGVTWYFRQRLEGGPVATVLQFVTDERAVLR